MLRSIVELLLGIKFDSREPYLLDEDDQPLALVMEGRVGRTPDHEDFSHDGTPHQNPDVRYVWRKREFLGIPLGWQRIEIRSYPLTVAPDGRRADIEDIEEQIDQTSLRGAQRATIRPMDAKTTKGALKVEDAGQRGRGVPRWLLRRDRAFEPYEDDDGIDWDF